MCIRTMRKVRKQQKENVLNSAILKYIMQISNETIRKLQIAITVPMLIENSALYSLLTQEEIEIVKRIFPSDNSTSLLYKNAESEILRNLNESPTVKSEHSGNTHINFFETAVFKMLQVLYSYPSIQKIVESYQMTISTQSSLFKHHLHYFTEYIISIMHMSPQEENERNIYYKKIWNDHKNALKEIRELTTNLEALRESKKKEMQSVITQYKNDTMIIDKLNGKCLEDIQNVSNKYEKRQYLCYKNWASKREELRATLEKIKTNLEILKNKNLNMTLNLDNKRVKIEAQLLALINQFDIEMDKRQTEFDELCETFESDEIEKNSLKETIKLQNSTYNLFLKDHRAASRTYLDESSEFIAD